MQQKPSKATRKECKMTELCDVIRQADHLAAERKQKRAAAATANGADKIGKKKKGANEDGNQRENQQAQPPPLQPAQNPTLDDVLAQAIKAAIDGIEVVIDWLHCCL